MRCRHQRVGAQRQPRIPPSTPPAPIAQHRRRDTQLHRDLHQRPATAHQKRHRLPLELIRKLTTPLAHSTPSRSSWSVHQCGGGSGTIEFGLSGTITDTHDLEELIGTGEKFATLTLILGVGDTFATSTSGLDGSITYDFTPAAVVPEPSSLAVLGAGLAGLAFLLRRKAAFNS